MSGRIVCGNRHGRLVCIRPGSHEGEHATEGPVDPFYGEVRFRPTWERIEDVAADIAAIVSKCARRGLWTGSAER
jgi:hypothetical protein